MLPATSIAKSLYELILSLHQFIDPNISKDFYLNRLGSFNQLSLLLEDMVFMFTSVSSKVRELITHVKPQRTLTLDKLGPQFHNHIQQSLPTQTNFLTETDLKLKKFTITSFGFKDTILKEKTLNGKSVRRQPNNLRQQAKNCKQNQQITQTKEHRPLTSGHRHRKMSINEDDDSRIQNRLDPYGDESIYKNSMNTSTLREKQKNPRKRRILSICIKNHNSPNLFIT